LIALFTPENIVIAGMSIFYAVFVWYVHPGYFDLVSRMGLVVYGTFGIPAFEVITRMGFSVCAFIFLFYVYLQLKDEENQDKSIALSFMGVFIAFMLTYLLQFKGFFYHRVPMNFALILAAGWV